MISILCKSSHFNPLIINGEIRLLDLLLLAKNEKTCCCYHRFSTSWSGIFCCHFISHFDHNSSLALILSILCCSGNPIEASSLSSLDLIKQLLHFLSNVAKKLSNPCFQIILFKFISSLWSRIPAIFQQWPPPTKTSHFVWTIGALATYFRIWTVEGHS